MIDFDKDVKLKGNKLEVDISYYAEDITVGVLKEMRKIIKELIDGGVHPAGDDRHLVAIETVLEYMGYDFGGDD